MSTPTDIPTTKEMLTEGWQALARTQWDRARSLFETAVGRDESAEALEGLSLAAWWLDDAETMFATRERAYRLYRERGDDRGAARLALALAEDALIFRGEEAVSNGWSERARRLLADLEPSPEHAVLAVRDAFFAFMLAGTWRRRAAARTTQWSWPDGSGCSISRCTRGRSTASPASPKVKSQKGCASSTKPPPPPPPVRCATPS